MPRARLISPEFWTAEAVVDCAPMTRLLLGLGTFTDDFGVLPLRPRTLPAPDHGKPSQSPRPPFAARAAALCDQYPILPCIMTNNAHVFG